MLVKIPDTCIYIYMINHDYEIAIIILVHNNNNNIHLECETPWNFEVQGNPPQKKSSDGANLWLWRNPEEGFFL